MARIVASDFIAEIRGALGGPSTSALSDARILVWVNRAYFRLCAKYEWNFLEKSTTFVTDGSSDEFDLDIDGWLSPIAAEDTTAGNEVEYIDRDIYTTRCQGTSTPTGPAVLAVFVSGLDAGNQPQVTTWPQCTGTNTITLWYRGLPSALTTTASDTSPTLPEPFDEIIINDALAMGWRYRGDSARAYEAYRFARGIESELKNLPASSPTERVLMAPVGT